MELIHWFGRHPLFFPAFIAGWIFCTWARRVLKKRRRRKQQEAVTRPPLPPPEEEASTEEIWEAWNDELATR
jgi:hypothetical protein